MADPEAKNTYRLVGFALFGLVMLFSLLGLVVGFNEGAQKFFFGSYEFTTLDTYLVTITSCLFLISDGLMLAGLILTSEHFFWPLILLFYFVMFYWAVLIYVLRSAAWLFCFGFVACSCYAYLYGVCFTRQEIIRNKQEAALR